MAQNPPCPAQSRVMELGAEVAIEAKNLQLKEINLSVTELRK